MAQSVIREGGSRQTSWWDQYVGSLRGLYGVPGNFSEEAIQEVDSSTDDIMRIENVPEFDSEIWDESNGIRIGAVVGSIQSGKTANMIGIAAKGIDRGFRIVIVLGGLKNDLRSQTANRFARDLLCKGESIYRDGVSIGCNHPLGVGFHGDRVDCWTPRLNGDVNHQASIVRRKIRKELARSNSVLIIAKKNVRTLIVLTEILESVCTRIPAGDIPMLIIDDEFDEASVQKDEEAPTPERISRLWGQRGHQVAYIGYTATIQANILQERTNPLFPRNFIELLRFPAARESPLTFFEPVPARRYSGGELFFNFLESHGERNFLVDDEMTDEEFGGTSEENPKLQQALISYFVSGAIRLLISDKSLNDSENLVSPHTMLIHTELEREEHWGTVRKVMQLIGHKGEDSIPVPPNYRHIAPEDKINSQHLSTWLDSENDVWKEAYQDFESSTEELNRIHPDRPRYSFPSWDDVNEVLLDVFHATKLRVINSDDEDEDLDFSTRTNEDGSSDLPVDLFSIIVGGNKLSRGLTLEGLCVSYFTRTSATIAEDTTVQRERWFGYRGPHLEFCRLFTNRGMANSLSRFAYHELDLKEQFAEAKRQGVDCWESHAFRFLRLGHSTPTRALGRGSLSTIQFSGTKPFIQKVQMGESSVEVKFAKKNEKLFSEICTTVMQDGNPVVNSEQEQIGYVLLDQSVDYVIHMLEGISYSFHNPDPTSRGYINLQDVMKPINGDIDNSVGFNASQDPYMIAAYLRYWKKSYYEEVICQGNDGMEWQRNDVPRFNVAIRFGSLPLDPDSPFKFSLMDREISVDGQMRAGWGSRGYGRSHLDEWFDAPSPHYDMPLFRPQGTPGLVLIHVVSKESTGRSRNGERYRYDRPTVALSIPMGGPSILSVVAGD